MNDEPLAFFITFTVYGIFCRGIPAGGVLVAKDQNLPNRYWKGSKKDRHHSCEAGQQWAEELLLPPPPQSEYPGLQPVQCDWTHGFRRAAHLKPGKALSGYHFLERAKGINWTLKRVRKIAGEERLGSGQQNAGSMKPFT